MGGVDTARWKEALESAKKGRMEELPADLYIRYYNTYKKVATTHQPKPKKLQELNNLWIHGETGSGKSHWAHCTFPQAFMKAQNKWWDGFREDYAGHEVVIIDDLHPKWRRAEQLKIWSDRFPFVAEIKGGSMLIRPKRFIVTSNYTPDQVFYLIDQEQHVCRQVFSSTDLGAILRKFDVVGVQDLPLAPARMDGDEEGTNLEKRQPEPWQVKRKISPLSLQDSLAGGGHRSTFGKG